jgi:hypothetical protein
VGERLGDREPALARATVVREQGVGELVAAARLGAERGDGLVEPVAVVPDDLAGAGRRVFDRLAVARQRQARCLLGNAFERGNLVA